MLNEEKSASGGEEQNINIQTPTPPTSQTSHRSNDLKTKLPWLIISILLVLLGVFGGYFVLSQAQKNQTPTPTPPSPTPISPTSQITPTFAPSVSENPETANWKVYTKSESGYSIKYPGENYVRLICPDEELTLQTRTASDTKDEVNMSTCGRGGRFEIEVVTADSFTEPATDDYVSVMKSEISIAAVTGRKYISTKKPGAEGPIPDWSEDIYFDKDGKKHLIHFGKSVSDDIKTKSYLHSNFYNGRRIITKAIDRSTSA